MSTPPDILEALRKTVRDFAARNLPTSHLRALRDRDDAIGHDPERWRALAELGVAGLALPESVGGSDLGFTALGVALEELGRTLAPTALLSTAIAARLLQGAGRVESLPSLADGSRVVSLAWDEGNRHTRDARTTLAARVEGGFAITGTKTFAAEGCAASAFLVVADEADGRRMIALVDRPCAGVTVTRVPTIDARNVAEVVFEGVMVPEAGVIARGADATRIVAETLDVATILLSAEMLGGALEVFDRTVAYLKTRKQFGVPIGSFQALKHRAAAIFCELELLKSVVGAALAALDAGSADVPLLASAAKARATDTYLLAANEAVQMHGGIGVTDELDIGFFLKRARVCEAMFGTAAFHRDRFATLRGY